MADDKDTTELLPAKWRFLLLCIVAVIVAAATIVVTMTRYNVEFNWTATANAAYPLPKASRIPRS